MVETVNKQIRLASRPAGWVTENNFTLTEEAIPEPGDGQFLVRNICMSVDPYMRGLMNDIKSYKTQNSSIGDLKAEIHNISRELTEAKLKVKALSE